MSNPIQLVLNLLNQLAIVLVIIYAGLYLFRQIDISRTYVMLVGVVDFVLLLVGRYAFLQRHRVDARAPGPLSLLPDRRDAVPARTRWRPSSKRAAAWDCAWSASLTPTAKAPSWATGSATTRFFRSVPSNRFLQDKVIDEVVFAVSMQELARLEPLMAALRQRRREDPRATGVSADGLFAHLPGEFPRRPVAQPVQRAGE